jgi:hypothetical protein
VFRRDDRDGKAQDGNRNDGNICNPRLGHGNGFNFDNATDQPK